MVSPFAERPDTTAVDIPKGTSRAGITLSRKLEVQVENRRTFRGQQVSNPVNCLLKVLVGSETKWQQRRKRCTLVDCAGLLPCSHASAKSFRTARTRASWHRYPVNTWAASASGAIAKPTALGIRPDISAAHHARQRLSKVGIRRQHLEDKACQNIRCAWHALAGVVHQSLADQLAEVVYQHITDKMQVSREKLVRSAVMTYHYATAMGVRAALALFALARLPELAEPSRITRTTCRLLTDLPN